MRTTTTPTTCNIPTTRALLAVIGCLVLSVPTVVVSFSWMTTGPTTSRTRPALFPTTTPRHNHFYASYYYYSTSSQLHASQVEIAAEKLKSALSPTTDNNISEGDVNSSSTMMSLPRQDLQTVKLTTAPSDEDDETTLSSSSAESYQMGIAIIGFITLLNASLSPVWHVVFSGGNGPPPLFLNAMVSLVAFGGLLAGGPLLDAKLRQDETGNNNLAAVAENAWQWQSFRGGMELGLWKGLGTTCHIYGMSLTSANHGAFLLQLTTLIVPVLQGLRGAEEIPRQIQFSVVLALAGIIAFTQDPSGMISPDQVNSSIDPAQMQLGDTLVLGAAFFYSLYDIQTYYWGREVPRTELVTIKIGFQAILSCLLCAFVARDEVQDWLFVGASPDWQLIVPVVLWSGLIVNALATFLQVGGMQSVGPTRAQTIFASQPLWASIMNFVVIGEVMGAQGFVGGGAFLGALFLAATAKAPPAVAVANDATAVVVAEGEEQG